MSSGGGSSNQTNNATTETVLPDWVQSQVQQNIGTANTLAAQPYQAYGGPTVAGFTPDQTAAFQAVEQMQGVAPGQISSAFSNVANLPTTIASLTSPYTAGAEETAQQQALRSEALTGQQIAGTAASEGALGGTREAVAQGMNESATQAALGQNVNTIASNAWLGATQNALSAAGLQSGLATAGQTAGLADASALYGSGAQQQTLQQAQYADALSQWQQAQNWPYQQLAISQSALAGSPYGTTVTGSQPYSSNTTAQVLGGIASAIPAIAGLPGAIKTVGSAGSALGGLFGGAGGVSAAVPVTMDAADAGVGAAGAAGAASAGGKGAASVLPVAAAAA